MILRFDVHDANAPDWDATNIPHAGYNTTAMSRKAVWIVCALGTIVPAGIGLVSIAVPFETTLHVTDSTRLYLAARSGCGRVIWMSAGYNASYPGRTPLDDYAAGWSQIAMRYFAWHSDIMPHVDGTRIETAGLTLVLFAPLGIAIIACVLFGSLVGARRLLIAVLTVCGLLILFVSVGVILFSENSFRLTSCFGGPEPWLHMWQRGPLTIWASRWEMTVSWDIAPIFELSRAVYWSQNLGYAGSIRFVAFQVATLSIPWIPTAALFLTYPLCVLVRGLLGLRRRHRCGVCTRCGYDLTGNVSGVCPECGTAIEATPSGSRVP